MIALRVRLADLLKNGERLAHFRAVAAYERKSKICTKPSLDVRVGVQTRKKYLAELPPVPSKLHAWWE